jgi:hypothetical protein
MTRSVWKGPFVDACLFKQKKISTNRVFCREYHKIWFTSFGALRPWFNGKSDNAPTSLVLDCCFIWKKNTSKTILKLKQNLDHYPIDLYIPPNNIISKTHLLTSNSNTPKILNSILPENINKFWIKFSETNMNLIYQLITILHDNIKLPHSQWQHTCEQMDKIV